MSGRSHAQCASRRRRRSIRDATPVPEVTVFATSRRAVSTSIYTVANDRFFVGLLGLVSSARANGHAGPIVVVDSGLTSRQIELLGDDITRVPAPREAPSHYLKAVGPLTHPDDVMLFIDSDTLCVRSLDDIVDRVRTGAVVAFEDIGRAGFSPALWNVWENRLSLQGLTPGTYVNGGFVAAPRELGTSFFEDFRRAIERVDPDETYIDAPDIDVRLPFTYACQDVINAVLASASFRPRLEVLPYWAAPHAPFRGVRVDGQLTCIDNQGRRPYFLHHTLQKPWLEPLPENPYTKLLVNYIRHPVAPVVDDGMLPRFLRSGPVGGSARIARSTRGHVRARVRGKLGLRPRVVKLARKLEARRAA